MNPRIHALVVKILDVTATYNMQFQSLWVPRELNVIADYMSHEWERSHYGYSLSKNTFERLDQAWGPHTIDSFSEAHNCRVASESGLFNSQFFCEGSEWVDAFTCDWSKENNWVHAPYAYINDVVDHPLRFQWKATLPVKLSPSITVNLKLN